MKSSSFRLALLAPLIAFVSAPSESGLSAQDHWLSGKPDSLFTIGASETNEREMLSSVLRDELDVPRVVVVRLPTTWE
jgi:hypothetical protein